MRKNHKLASDVLYLACICSIQYSNIQCLYCNTVLPANWLTHEFDLFETVLLLWFECNASFAMKSRYCNMQFILMPYQIIVCIVLLHSKAEVLSLIFT